MLNINFLDTESVKEAIEVHVTQRPNEYVATGKLVIGFRSALPLDKVKKIALNLYKSDTEAMKIIALEQFSEELTKVIKSNFREKIDYEKLREIYSILSLYNRIDLINFLEKILSYE